MSTTDTRAAFEAWHRKEFGYAHPEIFADAIVEGRWKSWQAATEAAKSFIHADELIGLPVSMDVSTGDDDADHRIFGKVIATMPSEDGIMILAEEESRNFSEAAKATGTAGEPDAFMVVQGGDEPVSVHFQRVNAKISANKFSASEIVPLYRAALAEIAAPVLSDEQILTIAKKELGHWNYEDDVVAFAQAILAATRSQL